MMMNTRMMLYQKYNIMYIFFVTDNFENAKVIIMRMRMILLMMMLSSSFNIFLHESDNTSGEEGEQGTSFAQGATTATSTISTRR